MNKIDAQSWKADMPDFREKTKAFYNGEMSKGDYKGYSGRYGSYAQKDGKASMLRLRMPAGRVTKEKLAFIAEAIRKYNVKKAHFTTCETIQLHDLQQEELCRIMEDALDVGIVTMGGGGDFPRNVMCSPLSGVEADEYFDVRPWAEAAGEYLMTFINAEKMPRKLKVCFSNSPKNIPHATYRDLGFVATKEGKFDVYSAGGLGNHARFGVKVAEAVEPEMILYYIKAMWLTFRAYGNYENRGKARTRYMQEALGGPEKYREAFLEKLKEVYASGENLKLKKMLLYTAKMKMPSDTTRAEMELRIYKVLEMVDLTQHADTYIRKLSGGQKKRASIAVELLADPGLFFLDEPTSGLDPDTEQSLMHTLASLSKSEGKTIIMVTHTTQSIHLCDKVIFMGPGGKICYCGPPSEMNEYFGKQDLVEIYNELAVNTDNWNGYYLQNYWQKRQF